VTANLPFSEFVEYASKLVNAEQVTSAVLQ